MPISLENTSNIRVTYNTGSNYIIETVKSDLYVRDTVGTTSNLFAEPTVNPSISPVTTGNHKTLTFPLVHNIVAYYKFNGDYLDRNPSTTKYNLSTAGTPVFQTTRFIEDQSVMLNADNEYLSTSVNFPTQFGMSFSFWFLLDSSAAASATHRIPLAIGTDFFIMILPGENKIYISNTMAGNETYTQPLFAFSYNTWYHMVFMFLTNGTWKLYMNGVDLNINGLHGTYPLTAAKLPTGKLFIGGKNVGYWSDRFLYGNIDEFFVFNKVLSQAEITSLYNKSYSVFSTYTLTFPFRTVADINNNSNLILQGDYNVNVGFPTSSVLPAITNTSNRLIPLPNTTTSTVSLRYHLLNPIKTTEGAQWTYSSNNPNVYHLGSVGIGTKSPEYSLDVRGFIYSSSGGYTSSALTKWSVLSDRRIKENIVKASYDKCLENVKNIELYNFNFKDNYVNTNDRHQLGFIAQEVQQIYPKAVEVSRMIMNLEEQIDDLLTLNTTQIDYTLYGSVKCLIQKLENIKIKMEQIKTVYNITT